MYIVHSKLGDLKAGFNLSQAAARDLSWWVENLATSNGKSLKENDPDLIIYSGACLSGRGGYCNGVTTRGIWPEAGRPRYINELELLYDCLRAFAGHASGRNVLMQLDNTKAVAYINKRGGLKSKYLNRLALEIFQWGENKGMDIKAVHLSGSLNFIADQESREHTDASDCKLSPEILKSYQKNGTCPLIYLLLPGILS